MIDLKKNCLWSKPEKGTKTHPKMPKKRVTTFIETKIKISDDQTNIDKYRLATNIREYHIISISILQRSIITNFCGSKILLR